MSAYRRVGETANGRRGVKAMRRSEGSHIGVVRPADLERVYRERIAKKHGRPQLPFLARHDPELFRCQRVERV